MNASNRTRRWIAGVVMMAMVAGACGSQDSDRRLLTSSGDEAGVQDDAFDAAVADDSAPFELPVPDEAPAPPTREPVPDGAIVMGRANWRAGSVQAQVIHDLLEELGYVVTDPGEREFAPDLAYRRIANGAIDFWANSWYPTHLSWWDAELGNSGLRVGDRLTRIDTPMSANGGMQGWLVTKSWAEANGVTTIDQINADAALWRQLDSDDDGKGEFYGCPQDWTCDDIMAAMATFAGWDNLEQVQRGYDTMFDQFLEKAEAGEPAIMYTWTPSNYLARAKLGETTMWISILDASVMDDSNPLEIDLGGVGERNCQRCDGRVGFKDLGPDVCLHGPDGCQVGWSASSIEITANTEWLEANPVAHELFRQVNFTPSELSEMALASDIAGGSDDNLRTVTAQWIEANRADVNEWLAAAVGADDD